MPHKSITESQYRKAKCCGTCDHCDKNGTCTLFCRQARPNYICNRYAVSRTKLGVRVACSACKFGNTGDHSCASWKDGAGGNKGCYAGVEK